MSQRPDPRPDDVKGALTVNRAASANCGGRPVRPSRGRRSEVENDDFARFAVRIIRAHGRRIAGGDVEGLRDLLALREELDAATQAAVEGLRTHGFSWGEIAARLGTSRQAAHQRWST
jgi:DNA-directed RNA polymerase specialized sigma24 family protein